MRLTPATRNVAFVTGASRGIGRAISLRLAKDGYDLALNDVPANSSQVESLATEIAALGRKASPFIGDVADEPLVQSLVESSADKLGPLKVLVANAGIARVAGILNSTIQDRKDLIDVNVHGLMNSYIAGAKVMIKQGHGGRIIGAASVAAYKPFPYLGTYSATKYAVRGFTQAAAVEWAQYGIRVNAYAPGIVDTPMWDLIDAEINRERGVELPKHATRDKYVSDLIALKRVSVPEDVAKVVSFLASEDSEYMTGQTVIVDGGCAFA